MEKLNIQKAFRKTVRVGVDCGDTLTEQSHKNQTDMNYILRDYARTGFINHAKNNEGKYDDISHQDFQEAMFKVASARSMFESLPAELRQRFNNNPAQFLEFAQNPASGPELAQMGVIRGNDGFDINGALTQAPTAESLKANQHNGETSPPLQGETQNVETSVETHPKTD